MRARIDRIDHLWNISTQEREPAPPALAMNDIGRIALTLAQPIFADRYADNRGDGELHPDRRGDQQHRRRGDDRMSGVVYLVGAGPGAPDLLTLRAAKLLAAADIVFHDALVHPDTIALAVRAEKIAVGKRCGRHSTAQQFINKRLVDAAHRHAWSSA